jgi:predicted SAM-dependent methyltransferase
MRLHGDLARLRRLWRPIVTRNYLNNTEQPALHIGCGGEIRPGWLNVDRYNAAAQTYLDAGNKFPFANNSFSLIFSEHMLEHLKIDRVQSFLSEVFRVLKPGGTCRLTCPNLQLYADAYSNGDEQFFDEVLKGIEHKRRKKPELAWIVRTKGSAFMTGIVKEFHGHHWMYDFETLAACLQEVGFKNITQRQFRDCGHPAFASMDNPDRVFETLYVEANK